MIGIDLGGTKILAGLVDADGHGRAAGSSARRRSSRRRPCSTRSSRPSPSCGRRRRGGRLRRSGARRPADGRRARRRQHPAPRRRTSATRCASGSACRSASINDGSAAALAEFRFGAGRGTSDLVLLTLGTGVGGGVVSRRPALPRLGRARPHGDRRGRRAVPGRVHRSRPRRVVLLRASPPTGSPARARPRRDGARPRRRSAIRRSSEIGRHLGAAIASLVNLFDPEVVVIGGGFGVAAASCCSSRRAR